MYAYPEARGPCLYCSKRCSARTLTVLVRASMQTDEEVERTIIFPCCRGEAEVEVERNRGRSGCCPIGSGITAVIITIGPFATTLFIPFVGPITCMPMCRTMDRGTKISNTVLACSLAHRHTLLAWLAVIPYSPSCSTTTPAANALVDGALVYMVRAHLMMLYRALLLNAGSSRTPPFQWHNGMSRTT